MKVVQAARLIDGTGSPPIDNPLVGIENGRIAWVRSDAEAPSGGDVVDARGLTVLPGLVDAHDHLGFDPGDEHAQTLEPDVWTTLRAVRNARQMLASGITTTRDMGEKNHIDVLLKKALNEGLMLGPHIQISGRFITITGGHGWYAGVEVDGVDAVRRAVREEGKHGVDLIKVMVTGGAGTAGSDPLAPAFSEEEIHAAVNEARRIGRPVAVHAYGGPVVRWSVEAGVRSIEHGSFCTAEDLALMAERGVFLVATFGVIDLASKSPDVPEHMREKCKRIVEVYGETLRRAREAGVRVAVGTDGYHGHLLEELQALRSAGYSSMEAIQAATTVGAAVCGLEHEIGTVEAGKVADLVAVEGDPLSDLEAIGQVRLVMHDGHVYDAASLV